jgi:flagellar hook-associated protein 1 FlgK
MPRVTVEGTILTEMVNGNPVDKVEELRGMNVINAMKLNSRLTAPGGTSQVAARTLAVEEQKDNNGKNLGTYDVTINGTADGTNAVNLSSLFNLAKENVSTTASVQYGKNGGTPSKVDMDIRAVGDISVNAYYNSVMSRLGTHAKSIDTKESAQDDLITQIVNWRSSTSGVDWNEELTNMIMFQKGYSACSRCLTTMDEMLDKLINSTGTVGR